MGAEDGVGQLDGGELEEMKQNKVQKVHSRLKSLHQSARSEKLKLDIWLSKMHISWFKMCEHLNTFSSPEAKAHELTKYDHMQ